MIYEPVRYRVLSTTTTVGRLENNLAVVDRSCLERPCYRMTLLQRFGIGLWGLGGGGKALCSGKVLDMALGKVLGKYHLGMAGGEETCYN
jgi:hypothetical protein